MPPVGDPVEVGKAPRFAPPVSASVVDLSRLQARGLTVYPTRYKNGTLSRVLGRGFKAPPVPRGDGWVARAKKGKQTSLMLRPPPPGSRCDVGRSVALHRDLQAARRAADHLQRVEAAINAITRQNVSRQAGFSAMAGNLNKARDEFVDNIKTVLTQGLFDAYDAIEPKSGARSFAALKAASDLMIEAKGIFDKVQDAADKLSLAYEAAAADDIVTRNRVIQDLTGLLKDLISGAKFTGRGPTQRALRTAFGTMNGLQKVADALAFAAPLISLGKAQIRLRKLGPMGDKELAALSKKTAAHPAQTVGPAR